MLVWLKIWVSDRDLTYCVLGPSLGCKHKAEAIWQGVKTLESLKSQYLFFDGRLVN